ncbi:penicillin-binding protein 1C [Tateyamaria sp. ANG-S1]|uniref:penicillin-binding protein 1C n=1 Tax=Tateyamaria sp. ANG-S1 TaxID=1577905 RepID=UPI00057E4357|nr:penicillin-binding protein 1C [Tateyamaria sp. ANG-S1]KIC49600.1 penicillin-binding protein [Tateyamaria sp. ANG-S1]
MRRPHCLFFATAAVMLAVASLHDAWDAWVDRTVLPATLTETSVEMRDRDGHLMRAFAVEDGRIRLSVPRGGVDPRLTDMLIAYEDKRFYRHNGVDGLAMLRAVGQAVRAGRVVSGGSTLTMQVARLLENSGTGSIHGKLRQMRVAWALERQMGKDDILHLYLQHAPYGGRIEGVRSATFTWFGKEPHRLTEAEAALLVALPQAPEARRSDRHADAARVARDRVLERVGADPSRTSVPDDARPLPRLAPHHADALRRSHPDTRRFDTTLSASVQRSMSRLARMHSRSTARGTSLAIMVMDHTTGEVIARVGSPEYTDADGQPGFIDMTRAKRSPGSTLKPVIYALAFDRGLAHPETVFADRPTRFGAYAPQNFDGTFRGDITARQALTLSLNIPPVALTDALGPERLMAALRAFGADPKLPDGKAGLAVSLGGVGLSLEDLVRIYGHLAAKDTPKIAPRAAWQVGDILRGIAPPPGAPAGLAYKTGTSYGHRDAWAIGYDGQHVIGVWMGRPDGTPVPGAFGGAHAAPILFEAFGRLKPQLTPAPPPPPDTLLLATADLPPNLRRFGQTADATTQPKMVFPPDGAVLAQAETVVKVAGGALPLTVLVNGAVVTTGAARREVDIGALAPGFSDISVIDALGRSARAAIRVQP